MPQRHCLELAESLGARPSEDALAQITRLVQAPPSTGRFGRQDFAQFEPADLAHVRQLGYAF